MQNLIERLEKAAGPDRELDLALGEAVGAADHSGPAYHRPFRDWAKHYTASIDAALTLVPDGYASAVGTMAFKDTSKKPWACYWTPQGQPHSNDGETPAIALCIAALKARATNSEKAA